MGHPPVELTMLKMPFHTKKYLFTTALCIVASVMSGCVESTFTLANESRLPRFLALPPGLTRSDVSVTMSYYVKASGRSATFILRDKKQQILARVNGKERGLEPLHLKNSPSYPAYEIVVANGITEIVEHRRPEPIFYVTDDPDVRKELLGDHPTVEH